MLLALLAVVGIGLLLAGLYLPHTGKDVIAERLATFNQRPRSLEEIELQQPFTERVLRPFIRQLADAMNRFQQARSKNPKETQVRGIESIQRKLALAGNPYRWTPADYLGIKVFAALVLGGVLFFLMTIGGQTGYAFLFGGIGLAFGWFGPELILRSKTQARQKQIQRALPDALDLLVISVEAGLGFDAAIQRLVDKRDDALATEFARVLAEMRVGRSRRDALKDMVQRTQVPDLNNFVGAILQAEQLGVSVTKVLTVQAEQMRVVRRQRAEEKAAQLQLKLIFPLAIFIFPALCVVIMGPIWPTMANTNAPGI
ncbi:MAG: type II secretion system F family protein [Chloroflexi bacterium]|nr:type II secretion system F family protein [Chloroflexota bacterium]MBV9892892.1 type II secretion system F family protein [Chloroflexota bacterium]